MEIILQNYAYSGLLLIALITFFETLVNFKKPLDLKLILAVTAFIIAFRSFGVIYTNFNGSNLWLTLFPNIIIGSTGLFFFSILHQYKLTRVVFIFGMIAVLLQTSALFYDTFSSASVANIAAPKNNKLKTGDILSSLIAMSYLCLYIDIFLKIKKKKENQNIYAEKIRRWSFLVLVASFFALAGYLIKIILPSYENLRRLFIIIPHYTIILSILFRPKFINRTNLKLTLGSRFGKKNSSEIDRNKFNNNFFENLYFLKNEASSEDFRQIMDITAENLANYVSLTYGMNLPDLINKHRVAYFVNLANSGDFSNHTINALAKMSGFNSRHHLYKSFKRFHGGSPSDILKMAALNN